MIKLYSSILLVMLITLSTASAMPIDWHGNLGFDSTLFDTYAKIDHTTASANDGSQQINLAAGEHANASFASYLFSLQPEIIINDSATIKGEMTTGYGRGGRLGDSLAQSKSATMGHALYMQNTGAAGDNNAIHLTKIYMELYSDTATYVIGRHEANWGLGAVVNSGENLWDRHTFVRDGITAKIKVGNFQIDPYIGKVSSAGSLTRATNSKEYGMAFLYENHQKGMSFGLLYGKRINNHANSDIERQVTPTTSPVTTTALGKTNVKITDIYFKQTFGDFSFQLEVPLMSGELGYVYNNTGVTKYKAKAILFESQYKASDALTIGLDAGTISGDGGESASYEAMYLNPNYQIAHLMFRYNMMAVGDSTYSIYDSYMVNAKYAKIYMNYFSENWDFGAAFIYAIANEVAKGSNAKAYNHLTGVSYTSTVPQDDSLGYEIDVDFNYKWNTAITIGALVGYHFVGDYYSFTNDAAHKTTAANSFVGQISTIITF